MAKKTEPNGHDPIALAMAQLIQNQAMFVAQKAETDQRIAKYEQETAERFARIEKDFAAIMRVLAEHGRILERLPEAVRERIGFRQ